MVAQAVALTVFVLAGNTLLRPLVNAINRIPLDERTSEATYYFKLAVTPEALPDMRDHLVEKLEGAKYPVADVNVVEHGDDLLEIVATLVSTAIDPNELNAVVAELLRQPGVRHATWEVKHHGLIAAFARFRASPGREQCVAPAVDIANKFAVNDMSANHGKRSTTKDFLLRPH